MMPAADQLRFRCVCAGRARARGGGFGCVSAATGTVFVPEGGKALGTRISPRLLRMHRTSL